MLIYRLLIPLWTAFVAAAGVIRVIRGRETLNDLRERLGLTPLPALANGYIWMHAASNGELASVRPLLDRLTADTAAPPVLVTTNSLSGREMARSMGYASRLAPVDRPGASRALMRRAVAYATVEAEFWPNRHVEAAKLDVPVLMVGTRLSASTARGWARFPALARHLLHAARLIVPQDEDSRQRLIDLGAPSQRTTQPVDLKSLYAPPPHQPPLPAGLAALCPPHRFWLAASIHPREDDAVLQAQLQLGKRQPDSGLILAPRHPARADDIAGKARALGLRVHLHSAGYSAPPTPVDVLIADTMGEMPVWYDRAFACFVGGSLAPHGGHTPFEPLAHDCPVLHGPEVANFAATYARLDAALPEASVGGATDLAQRLVKLRDGAARTEWLLRQQQALRVTAAQDTLDRMVEILLEPAQGLEIKR